MNDDLYAVLGVAHDADQITIKKAYRRLAMQFHPDKNPGDKEAEEKFKEAARAYEILGNEEKRARYDRYGSAGINGFPGNGGGFQDINDIFSAFGDIFGDFFGGNGRRGRSGHAAAQRGSDLRYILDITLQDVVEGIKKDIRFEAEVTCSTCTGSGAEPGTQPETCSHCGGTGQEVRQQGFFSIAVPCPVCRGEGRVIRKPCPDCRGRGRVLRERRIEVNVPAGVETGNQLRLAGEGEGGRNGGPAGDLYVEIRVKSDSRFERHGQDLIGEIELTYLQALLGAEVEVPTLTGPQKKVIPPGLQPGDQVRMGGEGLPGLRSKRRGDLLFNVRVVFPKKLKKEEEKLLRQIAAQKGEAVSDEKSRLFKHL